MNCLLTTAAAFARVPVIYHFTLTPLKYCQSHNGQIVIVFIVTDTKSYFALECGSNYLANYPGSQCVMSHNFD